MKSVMAGLGMFLAGLAMFIAIAVGLAILVAIGAAIYGFFVWGLLWATYTYLGWPEAQVAYWPDSVVIGFFLSMVTGGLSRRNR